MPTSVPDAIRKSQVFSFDGLSFPIAGYSTDFSQDIAQHKKPDRDGARLESTGRNPIVFTCRGLFYNGAVFDISANTSQPLYPDVHQAVLLRCADGTTGDLVHPELGTLRAKCASFKSSIDAGRRDGASVELTFVEDNEQTDGDLGTVSPLAFATYSALALDAALASLKVTQTRLAGLLANGGVKGTFSDTLRQVRAVADTATVLQKRGAAIIPSMQHDLITTRDSLSTLGTVSANNARAATERMIAALYLVQQTLLVTKKVALYVVPSDSTLAAIAAGLKSRVVDVLKLNPALSNTFPPGVVTASTLVRYYP